MIFSLLTVLSLHGSEKKSGLGDAITTLMEMKDRNKPVIFYSEETLNTITGTMNDDCIKSFLSDCKYNQPIIVVSDIEPDIKHFNNPTSTIVSIELGKKLDELEKREGNATLYQGNKVGPVYCNINNNGLIEYLKTYKGIAVFNMYHPGVISTTSSYANAVQEVLNQTDISLLAIIGPKYNGVNIEDLCTYSGVKPIVLNKPKTGILVWCKNHWIITGFSLAGLLGLIYYYKLAR